MGILERPQPHPRGHDVVLTMITTSPGTSPRESFFSLTPDLVVTGDGTAYAAGHGSSGGLVEGVFTFHLDEGAAQGSSKRAAHDGLLADHPTYAQPALMDGGETTVVVATSRGRWTDRAYAVEPGWGLSARGGWRTSWEQPRWSRPPGPLTSSTRRRCG